MKPNDELPSVHRLGVNSISATSPCGVPPFRMSRRRLSRTEAPGTGHQPRDRPRAPPHDDAGSSSGQAGRPRRGLRIRGSPGPVASRATSASPTTTTRRPACSSTAPRSPTSAPRSRFPPTGCTSGSEGCCASPASRSPAQSRDGSAPTPPGDAIRLASRGPPRSSTGRPGDVENRGGQPTARARRCRRSKARVGTRRRRE